MDEATWLTSEDPQAMLAFLQASGRTTERRLRLLASACVRQVWHLLARNGSRQAIVDAEAVADGLCDPQWLEKARTTANNAAVGAPGYAGYAAALAISGEPNWVERVTGTVAYVWEWEVNDDGTKQGADVLCKPSSMRRQLQQRKQSELARDIFGNVFQPAPKIDPTWLAWNNGAVRRLATVAYEKRALPAGTLDPGLLGILADSLEEAGCHDAQILDHLRSPGPHVRGCHVIDWLLGKE